MAGQSNECPIIIIIIIYYHLLHISILSHIIVLSNELVNVVHCAVLHII